MRLDQTVLLREGDFPVDLSVAAEATPAAFEVELSLADSVSQFDAGKRHGRGDERFETRQWS